MILEPIHKRPPSAELGFIVAEALGTEAFTDFVRVLEIGAARTARALLMDGAEGAVSVSELGATVVDVAGAGFGTTGSTGVTEAEGFSTLEAAPAAATRSPAV